METLLAMLKIDLGLTVDAYDARLEQVLASATSAILKAGAATLDVSDPLDAQLVVMYAAWLWRGRDEMPAMPRSLQWALHNRVFGEKMRTEAGT